MTSRYRQQRQPTICIHETAQRWGLYAEHIPAAMDDVTGAYDVTEGERSSASSRVWSYRESILVGIKSSAPLQGRRQADQEIPECVCVNASSERMFSSSLYMNTGTSVFRKNAILLCSRTVKLSGCKVGRKVCGEARHRLRRYSEIKRREKFWIISGGMPVPSTDFKGFSGDN